MDSTEQGALLLNSILNAVNLGLTAWIINTAKDTKREVRKNTRITTAAAESACEVRDKTNGVLDTMLTRLEAAAVELDRARERAAKTTGRTKRRRKKPPPKKRP